MGDFKLIKPNAEECSELMMALRDRRFYATASKLVLHISNSNIFIVIKDRFNNIDTLDDFKVFEELKHYTEYEYTDFTYNMIITKFFILKERVKELLNDISRRYVYESDWYNYTHRK